MTEKKDRGRPATSEFDARQTLLEAAKTCFIDLPYEKVTTRMLAEKAGVNIGLIRYYFINKQGLYQAVFTDMFDGVMTLIKEIMDTTEVDSFEPFFRIHAKVIMNYPDFPLLVQREILGKGHCQEYITEMMSYSLHPVIDSFLNKMQQKGKIKPDVDIVLLRLSLISLLIFPWLTRPAAEIVDGITFNDEMVEKLAKHNALILEQGCFTRNL